MKVRIGFGFGGSAHPGATGLFGRLVDELESLVRSAFSSTAAVNAAIAAQGVAGARGGGRAR